MITPFTWNLIMAKILVTGATGFIGKSLIPALMQLGHQVRVAVTKNADSLNVEQVFIKPIEMQQDWSEALQGIDVVIHLAARVHMMKDKAGNPQDEYNKVNSLATKNLAEQAVKHQVKRFIFLSSIKVNGEMTLPAAPFTEESLAVPDDPYGQSKLTAENYLLDLSQHSSMDVVIIRPPLVYGPGVKANFLSMLKLVSKKWPLPFAKIDNKRSFVFIDNLVSAICCVIDNPKAANQLYLVADDGALSIGQLLETIGHGMGVKVKLIPIAKRYLALMFKIVGLNKLNTRLLQSLEVSNEKIKSQLGWIPPVTATEGLMKTASWYKDASNR